MAESWQTIEQAAVSLRLSVRTINRHMVAGKLQSRMSPEGRREVLVITEDASHNPVQTSPASAAAVASGNPFEASVSAASDAVTGAWQPTYAASAEAPTTGFESAQPTSTASPASPFSQAASPPVSVDPETVLALADNAAQKAEMAVNAYQTLARVAETQVRDIRRQARFAWAAAALMAAGVTVTVGWATRHITRASADVERLQDEVVESKDEVRTLSDKQVALQREHVTAEQALRADFATAQEKASVERRTSEDALRGELLTAREQAARAEGQLAAYREHEAERQTRETVAAAAAITAATPKVSLNGNPTDPFDTAGIDALAAFAPVTASERISATTTPSETTSIAPKPAPAKSEEIEKSIEPTTRPTATTQSTLRPKARPATTRPTVKSTDAPIDADR